MQLDAASLLPPFSLAHLTLYTFVYLLVLAAISDLRRLIIPNAISLSLALLYLAHGVTQSTPAMMGQAASLALLVFIINSILFAFRLMGGGDVKFMSAVALWAGPDLVLPFVIVTTVCGGLLSLAMLFLARSPLAHYMLAFVRVKGSRKQYVLPYGVAIAVGGLYVAHQIFLSLTVS